MSDMKMLNELPDNAAREKESRLMLNRMASALEAAFVIAPGDDLVCLLGDGSERDNHEALVTWLGKEIAEINDRISVQVLPELAGRLHKALTAWELERSLG